MQAATQVWTESVLTHVQLESRFIYDKHSHNTPCAVVLHDLCDFPQAHYMYMYNNILHIMSCRFTNH